MELRRGLQYGSFFPCLWTIFSSVDIIFLEFIVLGTVLFDLDEQTLEGIYDAILNDAIANGQMNKDGKDEVLRLLISDHQ